MKQVCVDKRFWGGVMGVGKVWAYSKDWEGTEPNEKQIKDYGLVKCKDKCVLDGGEVCGRWFQNTLKGV